MLLLYLLRYTFPWTKYFFLRTQLPKKLEIEVSTPLNVPTKYEQKRFTFITIYKTC